jgi:hypothetical protein
MGGRLRVIAPPFVAAGPGGARVRARLRATSGDAAVLAAVGAHLGSLASADLAARCAEGRLDAGGRAASRAARKRALTAASSSRWAGAITRASEDAWRLADRNLRAERAALRARVKAIGARLLVRAGAGAGGRRGYGSQAERFAKQRRVQALRARLAGVEARAGAGRVSVCRGGRRLAKARHNLAAAGKTPQQWRREWDAGRWFMTADGEAGKKLGNETVRWDPGGGWLEIKLPAPLAHLGNRPFGRYRLQCPVGFPYRGGEVAAQAASGPVRYDISYDPARDRWYVDASWRPPARPVPALEELRCRPLLAVDLNHGHLDAWAVTPDGNPSGPPVTVPLPLDGLPATQRDGRLRAAITALITLARQHGCRAITVENLDFADARSEGRERAGSRPSRGRRGRGFRRAVSGIPTGKFRDRLVQMTANAGLHVIAVDPAYTSRWGGEHWLAPLRERDQATTGHHAAAVVTGRRAHGHRARRRAGVTGGDQRIAARRAAPRAPRARTAHRNGATPKATRQPPPRRKTAPASRGHPPDQAAENRPRPPTEPITTIAQ